VNIPYNPVSGQRAEIPPHLNNIRKSTPLMRTQSNNQVYMANLGLAGIYTNRAPNALDV
jgi:hypothetical protein